MRDKKGVMYILTNPSFPDCVKIGYVDDIEKLLKQLNRSELISQTEGKKIYLNW